MDVNDIAGVGKAIEKFIDLLRGFGWKIYEPLHIKRIADAESHKRKLETDDKIYEMEKISEFITKNSNLNINHNNNGTEISNANILLENTKSRLVNQELSRTSNIQNVISKTYDILKDEEDVSDKPVDKDWFTRYFNIVQDISNEDIQNLWAKLLAGEIKQPGSFSYRTLETLKNMTTDEAELFTKVAQFFIFDGQKNCYILNDHDLLKRYGVIHYYIVTLIDIGLINSSLNTGITVNNNLTMFNNNLIFSIYNNIGMVQIPILTVSKTGNEILKLIDNKCNSDQFFIDSIKIIKNMFAQNVRCTLHKIDYIDDKGIIHTIDDNEDLMKNIQ
ncbi:DUF2806 domain-containing protein [Brachyspira murdochii]|uniref:Membrane-fusion protein n=1 Tax=Brachyspira murdochii TaxID=84378 RepID=A0ABX5B4F7_9SPIR|nr:DUF2806 domain-containing protein [Brachyspira murdochii]PPS21187.1 membrane-fusion protein [Brachyspira murdochii]